MKTGRNKKISFEPVHICVISVRFISTKKVRHIMPDLTKQVNI